MPDARDEKGASPPTFADVVARRRMVRSFLDDDVPNELVDTLIGQTLAGPSAGNSQSLHLLVLTGDAVGRYWDVTLPAARREEFPWPGLFRAPVLIIGYVEPQRYVARYAEDDKANTGLGQSLDDWPVPYWWVDGGAAVQTLLLGAVALGLGACLFGQFDHESDVRDAFGVPDGMRAVGSIAIGYEHREGHRSSQSASRGRRAQSETVHRNVW